MSLNDKNIDSQIIQNMKTYYSGLLKPGVKSLGGDFMSQSIFNSINTNGDNVLSKEEIALATLKLESYIANSIKTDDFYAQQYFGEDYTNSKKNINTKSNKPEGEQIIENNLKEVIEEIYKFAKDNPEDVELQKYVKKLDKIIKSKGLITTDIEGVGIAGQANKDKKGKDIILIDNNDSISSLNKGELLKTLLHELRHTFETDNINSKAEELEAETSARKLASKIDKRPRYDEPLSNFISTYNSYAEFSPGTGNIPKNIGIAFWYKPKDVKMNDNMLVIKSESQANLKGSHIEDSVQFGKQKDENGNLIPISAKRDVIDTNGKVIFSIDYGKYDIQKKSFNYFKVKKEQQKFENELNGKKDCLDVTKGFNGIS